MKKTSKLRKVWVDKNKCIGCGTCVAFAPKSFKMGSDGKSQAINPIGDSKEAVQTAIDSCPVQAISWKE